MSEINRRFEANGQGVRIARKKLANGRPGVVISITVDVEDVAELAYVAKTMAAVRVDQGAPTAYNIRGMLANALDHAVNYVWNVRPADVNWNGAFLSLGRFKKPRFEVHGVVVDHVRLITSHQAAQETPIP